MSGQPDEQLVTDEATNLRDRLIVLTDVHAVGATRQREIGAIVHDEQSAMLVAQPAQPAADRNYLVVTPILFSKLHDLDAAAQRGRHHVDRSDVDYEVEARITQ